MARRRRRQRTEALTSHDDVAAACCSGNALTLGSVMSEGVWVDIDMEGRVFGRAGVVDFLLAFCAEHGTVSVGSVNGRAGLVRREANRVNGIVVFSLRRSLIDRMWCVLAPAKLGHWTAS